MSRRVMTWGIAGICILFWLQFAEAFGDSGDARPEEFTIDWLTFNHFTGPFQKGQVVTPLSCGMIFTSESAHFEMPLRTFEGGSNCEDPGFIVRFQIFPNTLESFLTRKRLEAAYKEGDFLLSTRFIASVGQGYAFVRQDYGRAGGWSLVSHVVFGGYFNLRNRQEYSEVLHWYREIDAAVRDNRPVQVSLKISAEYSYGRKFVLGKADEMNSPVFESFFLGGEVIDIIDIQVVRR